LIFIDVEKYPSSFAYLINDESEVIVDSYTAHRSDRVTFEILKKEDGFMDMLLMRLNSLSSLRLAEGTVVKVPNINFLNKDVLYGT